jgi:hypothetical protein
MSAAVPQMPPESAPSKMSEFERIVNVFVAPSKTFEDLRRNASWWAPWLILSIFSLAAVTVFTQKLNMEDLVRQQIADSPRAQQFESQPKEQQEKQIAAFARFGKILAYAGPVITLLAALVAAAILMAAFNFLLEAEVSYGRSLAVFLYSLLPGIVTALLLIIILMAGVDLEGRNPANPVATNLAYFLDHHNTSKFVYGMARSVDVITIWSIILMGIGFKVNSAKPKLSTGTAIGVVVALFFVWRLVASPLGL